MFITVIQLSTKETTIARFKCQKSRLLFLEGTRHPLQEGDLEELLAPWRTKSSGDRIILSLQPALFSLREIDLPMGERKKAREVIPLELKGETAIDGEEMIYEALPLLSPNYAAIWSGIKRLEPLIGRLAEAGLEPEMVTSPMFTWHHLLQEGERGDLAITDGEAVAIYREGKPVYLRQLPQWGENPLATTLAALELAKGIRVEQIFSLGSAEAEAESHPLPITPSLAGCFPGDPSAARDLASAYSAAADLAGGDPVNFRRGPLSFVRRRIELRRRLRLTWGLAAGLIILIFAEAGVRYYLLQRDLKSVESSIARIYRQAFPKRSKAVDEVAEMKAEIRRLGADTSQATLASLKRLAEAKGEDISEIYEVEVEGAGVSGKGIARSIQAVNDFKARCAPLFGAFDVNELKSRPDGSTGFSFRGGVKGGGK